MSIWRWAWQIFPVSVVVSPCLRAENSAALSAKFFDLSGQAGLPGYLKCDQDVRGGVNGLSGGEIKTTDTSYFKTDFTFDAVFEVGSADDGRVIAAVGIGENGRDGGFLRNSLECQIRGDRNQGTAQIAFYHDVNAPKLADISSPGPHLLRMQKAGDSLTFMFLDKYGGEDPDSAVLRDSYVVHAFKSTAPYLNRLNSAIYLTGNVTWRGVRLRVGGKDLNPGTRAGAGVLPVADNVPFYVFGPASRIPSFLDKPTDQGGSADQFTDQGWDPKLIYRTRSAEYLDKDFTLDLVVHFAPGDRPALMIGMGENGRDSGNWILNSVCATVSGPGADGNLYTTFHNFYGAPMWGRIGPDHPGPNLIRMQRRGDTLMFAVCVDYKGTFDPDFVTIMPSLRYQAPYLTRKNGYLFFGDHGVIEKLRLIVNGKSIDPNTGSPHTVPPITSARSNPGTSATKAPPGRGQDVLPPGDNRPKLVLLSEKHQLTPGLGGTLLLLEQTQLRRLAGDGFSVVQTWKLPHAYDWIGERNNYFVGMSDQTKSVDLIDKRGLRIIRQIQMDYLRRWDLCLSPDKPVSYVTVQKATDGGFANVILIVDEISGDVKEPEDFIGKFIKISPDGRTLYSAFNTIYQKGDRLLFNPDRIDVIPEYGDIDILIAYDVTKRLPRVLAAKNEAGANCQGLALSSDGRRVSFLSFVGYPLHSGNIGAWDSGDFTKRPVAYATKSNGADCRRLAFHPELPIAGTVSGSGAICFDRETGAIQKDRLSIPGSFDGTKVNDLIFAPDGTNLILDCEQNGEHFLVKVKVNLSPSEAAKAKEGPPSLSSPKASPGQNPFPKV
jgi:hypothetical protein